MFKINIFNGQTYPLNFLGLVTSWIMPIFMIILCADMVTEEYLNGTLALSLAHPVSRTSLMTAKAISLLVIMTFLLLSTLLIAYVIGTLFFGWGNSFMIQGTTFSTFNGILLNIGLYGISALPLIAFGMVVMFISLQFNSGSVVTGVSIGLMLILTLGAEMVPRLQPFIITTYFNTFSYSLLFFRDLPNILMGVNMIVLYGIGFYLASILVFKKRDLVC
jgi:ABC-2 type transport system permease protein